MERLLRHTDEVLAFVFVDEVPFTNNLQGFNLFEQLCAVQNGHSFLRPLALT